MTARHPNELHIIIRPTSDQAPGIVHEVLGCLRDHGWDASPADTATAERFASESDALVAEEGDTQSDGRERHAIEPGSERAQLIRCFRRDVRGTRHLGPAGIWIDRWTDGEIALAYAAALSQGLINGADWHTIPAAR